MMTKTRCPDRGIHLFGLVGWLASSLSVGAFAACTASPPGDPAGDASPQAAALAAARLASVRYSTNPLTGEPVEHVAACPEADAMHCFARVVSSHGRFKAFAAPSGYGPADLDSAYDVDPTLGSGVTIAIVDAYGYPGLEADLAVYRTQYGLPPCTVANGCLRIVNQNGQASPVAPNAPPGDDWTIETALDIDMVSAVCPLCNITVVQANDPSYMFVAEVAAAATHPTAISNSWGGPESAQYPVSAQEEAAMNHPGIGVFVADGDNGYDDAGQGPDYPGTSAYAISVGGTTLIDTASGWAETAWQTSSTVAGGSACSLSIPKPSYQPANTGCNYKATSDLAAVGDPSPGLAVYDAGQGGWLAIGGTSAATPIVASLFAAAGKGNVTGAYVYQHADELYDITTGSNGTCGTVLCNAGIGWDGPTGVGTPDQYAIRTGMPIGSGIPTVAITSPADQSTVAEGFTIRAMLGGDAVSADLIIDGALIQTQTSGFVWTAPTLADGPHVVEVRGYDANNQVADTTITVNVTAGTSGGGGGGGSGSGSGSGSGTDGTGETGTVIGGCSAAGSSGGGGLLLAFACLAAMRKRRDEDRAAS